jgi:hypothetical protein
MAVPGSFRWTFRIEVAEKAPSDRRVSKFDQFLVGLPSTLLSMSFDQCAMRKRHAPAYDSMPANGPGDLDRERD